MFNLQPPLTFKTSPHLLVAMLVGTAVPIIPALVVPTFFAALVPGLQLSAQAQDSLEMPDFLTPGTRIWMDGDPSLKPTTEALSKSFEQQFPGATIHYESQGSDSAVAGVVAGRLDVAAIGRGLTALEERAGVETISLPREKIATFVSVSNPFQGDISEQQFAQIFRGEITNWSELGGEDVPIRFIDLAATSDTRRALARYGRFQTAPFESGDTAIIQPNNISTVIENLGSDGIGYAVFAQVKDRPDVRMLPMHGVMPTSPSYPFSQPRNFAYLATPKNPEAEAFLGYVNEAVVKAGPHLSRLDSQRLAAESPTPRTLPTPLTGPQDWSLGRNSPALDRQEPNWGISQIAEPTKSSETLGLGPHLMTSAIDSATAMDGKNLAGNLSSGSLSAGNLNPGNAIASAPIRYRPEVMDTIHAPWWWLLPLLPLGAIGVGALRRHRLNLVAQASTAVVQASNATGAGFVGMGLLASRLGRGKSTAKPWTGGVLSNGTVANDDAAGFALGALQHQTFQTQTPHHQTVQDSEQTPSPQSPQPSSQPILQPASQVNLPAANAPSSNPPPVAENSPSSTLDPSPTGKRSPTADQPLTAEQLSIPAQSIPAPSIPAPSIPAPSIPVPSTIDSSATQSSPTEQSTTDQTWIVLTPINSHQGEVNWHVSQAHHRSAKKNGGKRLMIRIHDADPATQPESWLPSSYTYECCNSDRKQVELPSADRDYVAEIGYLTAEEDWIHIARSTHSHSPTAEYDGCRIVIMPCDPHRQLRSGPTRNPKPQAYVYWDIAPEYKRRLRKQGGQMLALRIYDADHINLDQQPPHHTEEYMLDENARDKVVTVPTGEHDYVAEIGYLTIEGEFLSLGRSVYAHIPVTVSQ